MRHVLERLLSAPPPGVHRALCDHSQPAIAEVLFELSRAKNLLLSPESYERSASHPGAPLIAVLWGESETELRRSDAMDFDDLLAFGVRLLADEPNRLKWLQQRWRWILVDEFQDTSHAQAMLVDLLAGPDGNLCVCGDEDQVVHSWRHADPRHILCFGDRHPGHSEIVLRQTFRSREEILGPAVSCVSRNEHRTRKGLIAVRGTGGQVTVVGLANEYLEAHWVGGQIAEAATSGTPPTEILAVARTGYATEPLQHALLLVAFPLPRPLPSTASVPASARLFGRFAGTTGLSDFPRPHLRRTALAFPERPVRHHDDGQPWDLRVLALGNSTHAQALRPRGVHRQLAITLPATWPSAYSEGVGTPNWAISRLNHPACVYPYQRFAAPSQNANA